MILRRLLNRLLPAGRGEAEEMGLRPVPDGVPKDGLFTAPLSVTVTAREPESLDGGLWRVLFRVEVRDHEGRRCPELAVGAELEGPGRRGRGEAHTDLLGRARFQREGPTGDYRLRLVHVAGGALELECALEELTASVTVG